MRSERSKPGSQSPMERVSAETSHQRPGTRCCPCTHPQAPSRGSLPGGSPHCSPSWSPRAATDLPSRRRNLDWPDACPDHAARPRTALQELLYGILHIRIASNLSRSVSIPYCPSGSDGRAPGTRSNRRRKSIGSPGQRSRTPARTGPTTTCAGIASSCPTRSRSRPGRPTTRRPCTSWGTGRGTRKGSTGRHSCRALRKASRRRTTPARNCGRRSAR